MYTLFPNSPLGKISFVSLTQVNFYLVYCFSFGRNFTSITCSGEFLAKKILYNFAMFFTYNIIYKWVTLQYNVCKLPFIYWPLTKTNIVFSLNMRSEVNQFPDAYPFSLRYCFLGKILGWFSLSSNCLVKLVLAYRILSVHWTYHIGISIQVEQRNKDNISAVCVFINAWYGIKIYRLYWIHWFKIFELLHVFSSFCQSRLHFFNCSIH